MKHANTIINADRSEVIPYDYEDYKAYVGDEVLSLYPAYTVLPTGTTMWNLSWSPPDERCSTSTGISSR